MEGDVCAVDSPGFGIGAFEGAFLVCVGRVVFLRQAGGSIGPSPLGACDFALELARRGRDDNGELILLAAGARIRAWG